MNRVNGKLLLLIAACALLSCEQSELTQVTTEIVQKEANSVLQVRTRTSTTADELNVSYPVNVYVFSGTKCVSLQTIADETQTLNISLTEGSYDVYAIGGATFVSVAGYIYIVAVCAELTVVRHILCGSNGSAVRLYKLYYVRPVKCYGYQVVVYLYYVVWGVAYFVSVLFAEPLVAYYLPVFKVGYATVVSLPHSLI